MKEKHLEFKNQIAAVETLHEAQQHRQIIDLIESTEDFRQDYQLVCLLARAYNNEEEYDQAISLLESVKEEGKADALWHFRLGYAYYYGDEEQEKIEKALELVGKAHEMGDALAIPFLALIKQSLGMDLSVEEEATLAEDDEADLTHSCQEKTDFPDTQVSKDYGQGKTFDERLYLEEMYRDGYFPEFLVDKIKLLITEVVTFIEEHPHSMDEIQEKFDAMTMGINDLEEEFVENDSEIETVARESIGATVQHIIDFFGLDVDCETAIQERDW